MLLNPFKGKNILVTGGSKGIGRAMAREFGRLGANVAIIARDKAVLAEAQKEISEAGGGGRILAYACDVRDRNTLNDYINMVRYEFGGIDGVVANSGYCHPGNFHEISLYEFDRQIDTNLKGVMYTIRLCIPHMLDNVGGFIAITSSPAGNAGIFGFSAYGATKAALNNFSYVLRQEYGDRNFRIHLLLPPDTDTPGYAEEVPLYPPETKAILEGGTLLSADSVGKQFVKGIANNRKFVTPGFSTRLLLYLLRWAPFMWDGYVAYKKKSARKKIEKESQRPVESEDKTAQ